MTSYWRIISGTATGCHFNVLWYKYIWNCLRLTICVRHFHLKCLLLSWLQHIPLNLVHSFTPACCCCWSARHQLSSCSPAGLIEAGAWRECEDVSTHVIVYVCQKKNVCPFLSLLPQFPLRISCIIYSSSHEYANWLACSKRWEGCPWSILTLVWWEREKGRVHFQRGRGMSKRGGKIKHRQGKC